MFRCFFLPCFVCKMCCRVSIIAYFMLIVNSIFNAKFNGNGYKNTMNTIGSASKLPNNKSLLCFFLFVDNVWHVESNKSTKKRRKEKRKRVLLAPTYMSIEPLCFCTNITTNSNEFFSDFFGSSPNKTYIHAHILCTYHSLVDDAIEIFQKHSTYDIKCTHAHEHTMQNLCA